LQVAIKFQKPLAKEAKYLAPGPAVSGGPDKPHIRLAQKKRGCLPIGNKTNQQDLTPCAK